MLTTISALGLPMARSVAAATFCGLTEKAVLAVRPVSARVRALTPVSLTSGIQRTLRVSRLII
jgi:hypothetical protein